MKELTLVKAIRFAFPGAILYFYLYLLFPIESVKFAVGSGPVGFPLMLVVTGSAIYFVYRPLVYDFMITGAQSWINPSCHRRVLMEWYDLKETKAATELFVEVRNKFLADQYKLTAEQAAGIHMMYIAGILGMPLGILELFQASAWSWPVILICGVVSFIAAAMSDRQYETWEGNMLKALPRKDVDEIAKKLGHWKGPDIRDDH